MTDLPQEKPAKPLRGIGQRQVRLGCGLVLFAYLLSHFLNHALGNISVEALATGVHYHALVWQLLPVAIVLYTAATVHIGLGLWALYQRRHFHKTTIEPLQLVLGLSIPVLIMTHIVGVRLSWTLFAHEKLYPQVLYGLWTSSANRLWLITTALLVAWLHGCIGLTFWLRIKPLFKRAAPVLLALAVLVPTLALLGIYQGGRSIMAASAGPQWAANNLSQRQVGTPAEQKTLEDIIAYSLVAYLGLVAIALAARGARALNERRGAMITLSYGNGKTVRVAKGLSVLEASLRHNLPHASVCGGRARCSTCRIRVIGDCSALPEPSRGRLSCWPGSAPPIPRSVSPASCGRPRICRSSSCSAPTRPQPMRMRRAPRGSARSAISSACLSTCAARPRLAEKRLPFDTVFIVNRFLAAVSQGVIAHGGQPNQFVGDGMLALFGLDGRSGNACRQALQAASAIAANVAELNAVSRT